MTAATASVARPSPSGSRDSISPLLQASEVARAVLSLTGPREASMEQKRIPPEAVELYSRFIHGEISRRVFLDGVKRYAVAGLTAGAIVEALMPNYALGQQVRKDDERIKA